MKKIFYFCIGLFIISALLVFCSKHLPSEQGTDDEEVNQIKKLSKNAFIVPDSIPKVVDDFALSKAAELNCSGIRLLQTSDNKTYYVTFFDPIGREKDGYIEVENYLIDYDPDNGQIISINKAMEQSLAKPATTVCWDLATIYEDASYGGDWYRITQAATNTGYFHKIIYDLAEEYVACGVDYSGDFNDRISSHHWFSYWDSGLYMKPDGFHVFKNADRDGPNKEWLSKYGSGNWFNVDVNYSDDHWWTGYGWEIVNDKVSSIDLTYAVLD